MTKPILPGNHPAAKDKEIGVELAHTPRGEGVSGEKDSVDRIRDILFGAQVRQYDQRFNSVEDVIKKEIGILRDETRKTNETLENYTKKGLESLVAQLKNELKDRADAVGELSGKLDSVNKTLDQKISRIDEKANAGLLDLQEQILQQSKNQLNEIQQMRSEITSTLKKAVDELRKEKTDRIALANLFNEIGMRLKEEFTLPKVK
jgi:uncharacterized phage infection (PIP) family protein YhgE